MPESSLSSRPVLVAGGINADVLGRPLHPLTLHTSNPAQASVTPGGVARNIAEHLARLLPTGVAVRLLGAVGEDVLGAGVLDATARAGVDVSGVLRRPGQTGVYLAVLDPAGELHLGLAAMTLTDALTPELTATWLPQVRDAGLMVLDANLPPATLHSLLGAARGVPVVLEPVSAPKAARLRGLPLDRVLLVTPDRAELEALSGCAEPEQGAAALLERGAGHVLLTLGAGGSVLYSRGQPPLHTPAPPVQVQDVTGAGDALVAGVCAALVRGLPLAEAVGVGHRCAALVVGSVRTVPEVGWGEVGG